jgi:3-oxoacyl-[acyl-carrier-protein] synthase III
MRQLQGVKLRGTGRAVPARAFRNDEFPPDLDTSDEWIRSRTGIRERRFCSSEETTATLGIEASRQAIEAAGLQPADVDLIICATFTPDMLIPSTACLIQGGLGCIGAAAFDLNAACSGFVYALVVADQFIQTGAYRHVLVVGSDGMSRVLDFGERATCVLFGDGAGAVVLSADPDVNRGGCWFRLGADGSQPNSIRLGGFAQRDPGASAPLPARPHELDFIRMNGREVFKFAVATIVRLVREALVDNELTLDDIALVIPHQVNQRILDNACEQLGAPADKLMVNLDRFGNTSAASVPIALDEAVRCGRLRRGEWALFIAFGGGLTWASALLQL